MNTEQAKQLINNFIDLYLDNEHEDKQLKATEYFNSHYQYLIKLIETRPDKVEAYLDKSIKKFLSINKPVKVKERKKLKYDILSPDEYKLYYLYRKLKRDNKINEITPEMRQAVNKYHSLYYHQNQDYKKYLITVGKNNYKKKPKNNKRPIQLTPDNDTSIMYKGKVYELKYF